MPVICFLVSRFPAETFILAQVEGLLERGADVEVYALAEGDLSVADALKRRWGDRIRLYTVPVSKSFAKRAMAALPMLANGNFAPLSQRYGDDARSLRLLIATHRWPTVPARPRVWLAQYGRWGRFACALRDLDIISGPVATMFHGKDMSAYLDRHPKAYATLFKQGDLFLAISELWQRRLLDLGAPPELTRLHRMGVDVAQFKELPRTYQPGDTIKFVGVGRLVEKKGFDDAIAAFAAFQANAGAPSATLTLIGGGDLRAPLEQQAAALGIADKVRFTGLIPNLQVAAELATAHIFVLPSRTGRDGDMEGVPVALMEAMAQGLPILTTRHSGIPELVHHDEAGLLSDEGDRTALAANMQRLATAPERWPHMGAAGAHRVRQEFDLKAWNDRLLEVMQSLPLRPKQHTE